MGERKEGGRRRRTGPAWPFKGLSGGGGEAVLLLRRRLRRDRVREAQARHPPKTPGSSPTPPRPNFTSSGARPALLLPPPPILGAFVVREQLARPGEARESKLHLVNGCLPSLFASPRQGSGQGLRGDSLKGLQDFPTGLIMRGWLWKSPEGDSREFHWRSTWVSSEWPFGVGLNHPVEWPLCSYGHWAGMPPCQSPLGGILIACFCMSWKVLVK